MVLLSIDIPNPRSTQGTSLTDLALNINTNPGYGGENIRNLHDTIVDMQLGVSAYVTKTYPATKGRKYMIQTKMPMFGQVIRIQY